MVYIPQDVVQKLGWSKDTVVAVFPNPDNFKQFIVEKERLKKLRPVRGTVQNRPC